jgi:hypothetical protein
VGRPPSERRPAHRCLLLGILAITPELQLGLEDQACTSNKLTQAKNRSWDRKAPISAFARSENLRSHIVRFVAETALPPSGPRPEAMRVS